MWNNARGNAWWIRLATCWILTCGTLAGTAAPAQAHESAASTLNHTPAASNASAEAAWMELDSISERPDLHIWLAGRPMDAAEECFVITHGLGGTVPGDRFHRLAAAIHKQFPRACVLRIDWSEKAGAKLGGIPHVWKVAGSIDDVGDQVAPVLSEIRINPGRTTLIGESFGNWVNARIAHNLGGVHAILALNPASEAGGYNPPDLRKVASHSWSFHTYSVFDTTHEIADSDFWLETPTGTTHFAQHIAGISWLAARIESGDPSWLQMEKSLPRPRPGHFRAMATMKGDLREVQLSRERPIQVEQSESPAESAMEGADRGKLASGT